MTSLRQLLHLCGFLCLLLVGYPSLAYEYNGSVRAGYINSKIDYSSADLSGATNDVEIFSTRLNLDVDRINRKEDLFTLDLRDRYDFFGKVDSEILQLSAENTLQIREAAYKRPWENNRTFYSVGRFSLPSAGILANDGGEYGYRMSKRHRVAAFIGIAPEDVLTPASITPEIRGYDGNQGGVYSVYEKKILNGIAAFI